MEEEKEYISVRFLDFSCFHTYVFIFRGKKTRIKIKKIFFSSDGETERERRRKFGEGNLPRYTNIHL